MGMDHIRQISKKLTKIISSFKIIKHYIPDKCKLQLFHPHINSRLKYGLEVYGHASKTNMQKLQILQNKSLKILFNEDWYTPTFQLHKELLQLLKLVDNFNHSILQIVYMQRNNLLPSIFDDYFIMRSQIHRRQTRFAHQLNIIYAKSNYGNNTLRYKGTKLYNNLPEEFKQTSSLEKNFKRKVKKHYIESY